MRSCDMLPAESLKTILDEDTYLKVLEFAQGYTIHFSARQAKYERIKRDYKNLKKQQISKPTMVKILQEKHNISRNRIYEYIKMFEQE